MPSAVPFYLSLDVQRVQNWTDELLAFFVEKRDSLMIFVMLDPNWRLGRTEILRSRSFGTVYYMCASPTTGWAMGSSKRGKSNFKALLVIAIIIIAAVAGAYYYISTSHAPQQFTMTVNPPFFHAAAGGGFLLFIQVQRIAGFAGEVNVTLQNPPSWLTPPTLVLNSTSVNGSLVVPLSKDATKGAYQLTVVGTAQASASQTVMVSLKVVGVKPLTSNRGSALVYDTTKTLSAATLAALVSVVNNTFQFSQSTSQLDALEPGDVIAASFNQTPILPHGFIRTVLAVRNSNGAVFVDTRVASVLEAAEEITIGVGKTSLGSSGTSVASVGSQPQNAIDACNSLGMCMSLYSNSWEPLGANGVNLGGDANFYLGATLQLSLGGGGHISWGGVDWLVIGLFGHEEAKASIKGSALDQFTWANDKIQTLYQDDIPIVPPILNFHLEVDLAGRSSGTLLENVNTGIDQTFDLVLAITDNANSAPSAVQAYCSGGGWSPCASAHPHLTPTINISPPRNPGSECNPGGSGDCARVEIGPKLYIGINGNAFDVASVSGGGDGEVDVFWELDNQAGMPVWSLYMGLTGRIGVYASAGFDPCFGVLGGCYVSVVSFSPSWPLPDFVRIDLQDAGNLPPPTPALIIPNAADTISLSNPAFLNPNMFGSWVALMGVEPEGEAVTCIWSTAELGQLGTSPAVQTGGNSLSCHGPGGFFPDDQVSQIISRGMTTITVSVVAEDSAGEKSPPSNDATVNIVLPAPYLQIEYPTNGTTVMQNQPFNGVGSAKEPTVISNSNPNGIIDFCQTQPQNVVWFVGGYFGANRVDVGEGGWIGADSYGAGCNPSLTATSTGQVMIYMTLLSTDPQTGNQYITQTSDDDSASPLNLAVAIISVQPQTTQTAQAGPPLIVQITPPFSTDSGPEITTSSGPIQLTGSVTGGTPPYTVTWYYTLNGQQATIVSGGSDKLSYTWSVCSSVGNTAGTANVFLEASDANGAMGNSPAGPIGVSFNCETIQALPPFPGIGIAFVTLLTNVFALIANRGFVYVKPFRTISD